MKTFILLSILLVPVSNTFALRIRQLSLSPISAQAINISLDTEAVELYYFQSWQYAIEENTIALEVFYVPGFGSTIAYLNNNFEIPINTEFPQTYSLIVKLYYVNLSGNAQQPQLQDEVRLAFQTPLLPFIYLEVPQIVAKPLRVLYPNPTDGRLCIIGKLDYVVVFDSQGRRVMSASQLYGSLDLSGLESGVYFVEIHQLQHIGVEKILKR